MGEEHPDTTSVGDLASSLVRQGKSVEAEEMLQASLVARRRVLGNAHPHTLITAPRLGTIFLVPTSKFHFTEACFL